MSSTSMLDSGSGWQSGISEEVCLAARMPARRAVCSGSPFLTAPVRIKRTASRDMVIVPRATASRLVIGLSPTSTIFTRPRTSTCDKRPARPAPPALLLIALTLREEKRQAFERHRQVDALQLHVWGYLQRAGRKIQDRLDAGRHHQPEHVLRVRRRNRNHRDANAVAARDLFQVGDVVNRHAASRLLADLLLQGVEQRRDLKSFLSKARIVGEGQAKVAGAHDRHPQLAIDAEDLAQVPLEVADVVADAAH